MEHLLKSIFAPENELTALRSVDREEIEAVGEEIEAVTSVDGTGIEGCRPPEVNFLGSGKGSQHLSMVDYRLNAAYARLGVSVGAAVLDAFYQLNCNKRASSLSTWLFIIQIPKYNRQ